MEEERPTSSQAHARSRRCIIWSGGNLAATVLLHLLRSAPDTTSGSRPHADYHNRFGYRQERVSGPRHRCGREGRRQEATATQPGVEVFCVAAALPHWHGGVCHGALLGT